MTAAGLRRGGLQPEVRPRWWPLSLPMGLSRAAREDRAVSGESVLFEASAWHVVGGQYLAEVRAGRRSCALISRAEAAFVKVSSRKRRGDTRERS